jgi:hypothetical protein
MGEDTKSDNTENEDAKSDAADGKDDKKALMQTIRSQVRTTRLPMSPAK